jgi:hypothetical protein
MAQGGYPGRWGRHDERHGDGAGIGDGSLNAKDNFQFERTIVGFRGRNVVDLRRKQ